MSRTHGSRIVWALVLALLVSVPVSAGMFMRVDSPQEAIRLWHIDQPGNGIYHGKVTHKEVVSVYLADSGPDNVEVTLLTIQVVDEVSPSRSETGKNVKTIQAMYRGGISYRTSAQPADRDTVVGGEVIVFLTGNPYADIFPNAKWIAGLNSVFQVKKSSSGNRIAIGKGDGMPVNQNTLVTSVMQSHRAALALVRRDK